MSNSGSISPFEWFWGMHPVKTHDHYFSLHLPTNLPMFCDPENPILVHSIETPPQTRWDCNFHPPCHKFSQSFLPCSINFDSIRSVISLFQVSSDLDHNNFSCWKDPRKNWVWNNLPPWKKGKKAMIVRTRLIPKKCGYTNITWISKKMK